MKIYTRKGDDGGTGLFGGGRVSKANARVATYGDVDELNSVLGVCRAAGLPADVDQVLGRVQNELFQFGAELSTSPEHTKDIGVPKLSDADVEALEQAIDRSDVELAPLTTFVLPGGSPAAAHLNVARTVCRRAERALVALAATEPVRGELLRYLNRLSDLLFTFARLANHRAGVADVPWLGRKI